MPTVTCRSFRSGRLVVLTAVVLVAGACSGDDSGGGSASSGGTTTAAESTTTTAREGTSTTTEAPAAPEDDALAEKAVLKLDELPAGWSEQPVSRSEAHASQQVLRTACPALGGAVDDLEEANGGTPGRAEGRFLLGSAGLPQIQSGVSVAKDADVAARGFDVAAGMAFVECFMRLFEADATKSDPATTFGETTTTRISLKPAGDRIAGSHAAVTMSREGAEVEIYMDLVVLRVGRVLHSLLFASADLFPLPGGTERRAIVAAARL